MFGPQEKFKLIGYGADEAETFRSYYPGIYL
jgi:hypothetical protein